MDDEVIFSSSDLKDIFVLNSLNSVTDVVWERMTDEVDSKSLEVARVAEVASETFKSEALGPNDCGMLPKWLSRPTRAPDKLLHKYSKLV